jgi:2-polyprenyl-6-hydroxyphenyl methylase/3-demethylubiquinone-9 3-methyltransferase
MASTVHSEEIAQGERFEFGRNWSRFLTVLNEDRIEQAEASLRRMLQVENLDGMRFLDIGSGSGLFSLAAKRLGAKVQSFDYDPFSVACTRELRQRYFPNDPDWTVAEGSALDADYVKSLGQFDVVYSWGVLHHTGDMWKALEHASLPVAPGGKLFIAIYNDTGSQSSRWKWIKKTYNRLPGVLQPPFAALTIAPTEIKQALSSLLTLRPGNYLRSWTEYESNRGMTKWRDIVDWVGGYPYEVAKPEEIFDFFVARGFSLTKLKCGVGLGCSEYVFVRSPQKGT